MTAIETVEGGTAAAVKFGAGLLTHWQALAFAALALISGLSIGALYFYDKGYTSASVKYEKAAAESVAKADAERATLQAKIDAGAAAGNAELSAKIDGIKNLLPSKQGPRYAPTQALPANCLFDDERVQLANSLLAQ
jgi:hypothetical protein